MDERLVKSESMQQAIQGDLSFLRDSKVVKNSSSVKESIERLLEKKKFVPSETGPQLAAPLTRTNTSAEMQEQMRCLSQRLEQLESMLDRVNPIAHTPDKEKVNSPTRIVKDNEISERKMRASDREAIGRNRNRRR